MPHLTLAELIGAQPRPGLCATTLPPTGDDSQLCLREDELPSLFMQRRNRNSQASTLTIHMSENCLLVPGFVSDLHSDVERLLQRSNMHVPCSNTYQSGTTLSARRCLTGPLLSLDTASDRSCRIKTERVS